MRPKPIGFPNYLVSTIQEDRHRSGVVHQRVGLEERIVRPSPAVRLGAAILRVVRRDRHSLTKYPCRLPDGKIGRTAVVYRDGEWTLVCRVA